MIYEQYLEKKKQYQECLIFIKVGHFYQTFDEDGIILNYLFDYKIIGTRVGFPVSAFATVIQKLEHEKVSYFSEERSQLFDDNHYRLVLGKGREILELKEKVGNISKYLNDNIERKYIRRIIDKIEEVIDDG